MNLIDLVTNVLEKEVNIKNPKIKEFDISFSPRSWMIFVVHIENENSLVLSYDVYDKRYMIDMYPLDIKMETMKVMIMFIR